jgi:hypothetical protein
MTVPVSPLPALFQANVNVAKIGSIIKPFNGGGSFQGPIKGGVVNGDAVFFSDFLIAGANALPHGVYAARIQPVTGVYGEYVYWPPSRVRSGTTAINGIGCQQVGPNTLQVFDNGTNSLVNINIPNQPNYGTRVYVGDSLPSIPSPCGVGTVLNTFYDASQGIVAYEFDQNFALDFFDYVSIYRITQNGESLINGGFIGVIPQGGTGFNQTALSLPASVTAGTSVLNSINNINYQNGWGSYCTLTGGSFDIGAYQTSVIQGGPPLNCNTTVANTKTFVTTKNQYNWNSSRLIVLPNFVLRSGGAGTYLPTCYCEVPGIFVYGVNIGAGNLPGMLVFANGVMVQVTFTGNPQAFYSIVMMSNGVLIGLADNGVGGYDIYQGEFPLYQFNFLFPYLTFSSYSTLVNYARPISVNGSYLT